MSFIKRVLGIKSDAEIRAEVADEPTIQEAQKHLAAANRVLNELRELENLPPPRPHVRAKHVRT